MLDKKLLGVCVGLSAYFVVFVRFVAALRAATPHCQFATQFKTGTVPSGQRPGQPSSLTLRAVISLLREFEVSSLRDVDEVGRGGASVARTVWRMSSSLGSVDAATFGIVHVAVVAVVPQSSGVCSGSPLRVGDGRFTVRSPFCTDGVVVEPLRAFPGSTPASSTSADSVVKARWTRRQSVGSTLTGEPVSSVAGRFCSEHSRVPSLLLPLLPLLLLPHFAYRHRSAPLLGLPAGVNGPWSLVTTSVVVASYFIRLNLIILNCL
jgi:hypothetical protein